jgi:hypothetical protein
MWNYVECNYVGNDNNQFGGLENPLMNHRLPQTTEVFDKLCYCLHIKEYSVLRDSYTFPVFNIRELRT